jgi:hypothetical protein
MTIIRTIPLPDFGRPEARKASIFVYAPNMALAQATRIAPPIGWRADGMPVLQAVDDANLVLVRADLIAEGPRFEVGSPATVHTDDREYRVSLTSDCLTLWRLAGPFDAGAFDTLDMAVSAMERAVSAAKNGIELPETRDYLGLATSGYVNLTAFLENIWGPVPSGDYRVWKRSSLASTFVRSGIETDALFEIKGEDRFALWVNELPLQQLESSPRLVPARIPLQLRKGWNRLRIASAQEATREWGGRRWGFEARLLTPAGRSLSDLQISINRDA